MSTIQLQERTTNHLNAADADLLRRLRIALSIHKRAGWHLVHFTAQNGIVQLSGVVPTYYDRQLIAALVRHVAGVYGIEDDLIVGDPAIRQQLTGDDTILLQREPVIKAVPPRDPFQHVPVLSQSLDDMLAGTALSLVQAS
jgi:BON domain